MIGGVDQSDTAARFQSVAVLGGVINQRQNLRPMCSELAMSRNIHRRRWDTTIYPLEFFNAAQATQMASQTAAFDALAVSLLMICGISPAYRIQRR